MRGKPKSSKFFFSQEYTVGPAAHKSFTARRKAITLDNKFQKMFVSVMNMLLIYLFVSMKLEKGHKKDYLALVLKICYSILFYKIG